VYINTVMLLNADGTVSNCPPFVLYCGSGSSLFYYNEACCRSSNHDAGDDDAYGHFTVEVVVEIVVATTFTTMRTKSLGHLDQNEGRDHEVVPVDI
jgi:hypothetical protein